ncbi:hypothetical protein GCM10010919_03070 [Alishewanella longhuensis]|uniref:Uncharacterized protein n=2 Tax=Alishewanella longhuensis TaxID=1091037 RepID=A0ABQ3KTC8_9ALTE|nr:hypothetical protein [Alishewanella sp. BS5-314]MCT8127413.1 hypothetical protein [Alishewanella sp. BS5-314]GHG60013.1 hypothetical protein GCM10010919_03070 [Alishewanella longhuensis]
MKYLFVLITLIFSSGSVAESLVPKLSGSCEEITNTFNFIEREKDYPAGVIHFEGVEGIAAVICEENLFKKAMIIFELESFEMAYSLYKSLENNLILTHGNIDIAKTHEVVEALYTPVSMFHEPGFLGTTVYAIWPEDKNGLNLKVYKAGRRLTVAVVFGN